MTCGPAPGMSKWIRSPRGFSGNVSALMIACRSDPRPLSFVLVTTKGSPMYRALENSLVLPLDR